MKKVLWVALAVSLIVGCDSKPDAPFGLKWGQTVKETVAQNLKGAVVNGDEDLLVFINADSTPDPVQYVGRYYLAFYPDFGLTSASFSTKVDESGSFFNEGRTVYNSIAKKLEEKYGPPKNIEENVDRDGADFYSCIKEKGCGKWERTYQHDGMDVKLSIKPMPGRLMDGFAKGYVDVDYGYFTEKMKKTLMEKSKIQKDSNNF